MSNNYKDVTKAKKAEAERLMSSDQLAKCHVVIHSAAVTSGAAGAVPIPAVDAIPISAAQITMVIALGKIFDQVLTESAAQGIVKAVASSFVGRNLVKFIPVLGWGVSAAVAVGITEAVGWSTAVDFARQAKATWEAEHRTASADDETSNQGESFTEEEAGNSVDRLIADLELRAQAFLSGEKTVRAHKVEYNALIKDFEDNLDVIPIDHPVRKVYDELTLLDV